MQAARILWRLTSLNPVPEKSLWELDALGNGSLLSDLDSKAILCHRFAIYLTITAYA
jgi:hypothetical protein